MEEIQSVRGWIEDLPKHGRIIFCFNDLKDQFPNMTNEAIRLSVHRLKNKGRVSSVWRKYYVVVPDEYASRGFVPPIEYIDKLMSSLGHKYYVGLLSAAALLGSSHQQPQSFMIVVNSNDVKSKADNNISLRFIAKSQINKDLLLRKNASYGEVLVSNPIMTALDLILYENRIGGLERAAEVIGGLADEFKVADSQSELWTSYPIPVVQRFGYILESILGYAELSDAVYQKIRNTGIKLRKIYLDSKLKHIATDEFTYDSKWKMIVNTDLELD